MGHKETVPSKLGNIKKKLSRYYENGFGIKGHQGAAHGSLGNSCLNIKDKALQALGKSFLDNQRVRVGLAPFEIILSA